ncbi:MAG: chitin deacetylase [Gemmataceae bacterium]|nr:chitin deacetylase [Gemmataceae bacterium]
MNQQTRRAFLAGTAASAFGLAAGARYIQKPNDKQALIAISLDLEMSRNFPKWEDTFWDYEKGNLNEQTKKYTQEACARVKASGGVVHCFALGRTMEQENVDWLKRIIQDGHFVGNHTYDHVYLLAEKHQDLQFRFSRSPWLIEGKSVPQVIEENISLAATAINTRLGIRPSGFRTPGGFAQGLSDKPKVRALLKKLGYSWVSSKYPSHPAAKPGVEPDNDFFQALVKAQTAAQPFRYPDGLVEIPMSPISDIGAFRTGRWKLDWFLKAVRAGVEWALENRAVFDFLGHPSCLYVVDPEFKTIELICELVKKSGKGRIVGLEEFTTRAAG